MALQFTREEVERPLRDILTYGDIRQIAIETGISEAYIAQQLNPDNERDSHTFIHLKIQCAIDSIDRAKGDRFFTTTNQFRDLSITRRYAELCPGKQTNNLLDEVADFIKSRLCGDDIKRDISELLDIERVIKQLKQALIDEHNKIKCGEKKI